VLALSVLLLSVSMGQQLHDRKSPFMPHRKVTEPKHLPPLDLPVGSHFRDQSSLGFDQSVAMRYLMYSYAAYQYDSLMPWTCGYCTYYAPASSFNATATFYDDTTDARGFIGYNDAYQEIVISFRGSSSLQNWIDDLKIYKDHTPFGGGSGSVATGFYEFYMALQSQVVTALMALAQEKSGYSIVVTGHSLGAAASNIAALDLLVNQGYTSVQVQNFGCPRVGDSTYSAYWNSIVGNSMRMTHDADIVPHLPPQLFNFQHETTEVWGTDSGYTVCNGNEDPTCSDSVPVLDYSVSDHLSYMGVSCCDGPTANIAMPNNH